ncbi:MAG: YggT family protein [Phototrophicales bacterium]|nr:YggT family protein [Phototrophicales bacterium]
MAFSNNNELRNQELGRHEEVVGQNIEEHQAMNLNEKKRRVSVANQNSSVARIVNISYFLFGALELLLIVRFILYLVGANMTAGFGSFINTITAPFVALFSTLLQNPVISGSSILEITTIIAIIVWAMIAWVVARMLWLILSRTR